MSNVIQFLAAMGSDSGHFSAAEYAANVTGLGLPDAYERALIDRDTGALSVLLRGRESMRCIVWPTEAST
jgi:hypothetical protein